MHERFPHTPPVGVAVGDLSYGILGPLLWQGVWFPHTPPNGVIFGSPSRFEDPFRLGEEGSPYTPPVGVKVEECLACHPVGVEARRNWLLPGGEKLIPGEGAPEVLPPPGTGGLKREVSHVGKTLVPGEGAPEVLPPPGTGGLKKREVSHVGKTLVPGEGAPEVLPPPGTGGLKRRSV